MQTIQMLLAQFNAKPVITLAEAACYFDYKPDTLKQKIDRGQVRLPYFSLDPTSQKCALLVRLIDLAALIDSRFEAAEAEFSSVWAEMEAA